MAAMVRDKWIGLALSSAGNVGIGLSFIILKKGLNDANTQASPNARASDDLAYLKNPIWWIGMTTMVTGEIANFAAYAFAPPILVTPLGALSVLVGAILASFLLNERLGHIGRVGCTLCLLGSLIIVLHAPADKEVQTVDEILHYAIQPGFLLYCLTVTIFTFVMIYLVVPKYGRKNPLAYVSICSLVGSVSVMGIKGFGIALKLTFGGDNQLTHPSTYVFGIIVAVCIAVQMNYFNKALDTFSTNVVNPMYYVGFSTMTLVASLILFQGLNTSDASGTLSLLAGFAVTFLGVHLLNLSRAPEPPGAHGHGGALEAGLMNPRLSIHGRPSMDGWGGAPPPGVANGHARGGSRGGSRGSVVFNAYEDELPPGGQAVGLERLEEGSEEDDEEVDERTTLRSPAARVREREERRARTSPRGSPMGRSTPTLGAQ